MHCRWRTSVAAAPASAEWCGRRRPDRSERRLAARLRTGDPEAAGRGLPGLRRCDLWLPRAIARRSRGGRGRPAAGLHRGLAARGRLRPAARGLLTWVLTILAPPRDRSPAPARPRAARPATARSPHGARRRRRPARALARRAPARPAARERARAAAPSLLRRAQPERDQRRHRHPISGGGSRRAWCAGSPACARYSRPKAHERARRHPRRAARRGRARAGARARGSGTSPCVSPCLRASVAAGGGPRRS